MVIVRRAGQDVKALSDIATREVGRHTLVRLEFTITKMMTEK